MRRKSIVIFSSCVLLLAILACNIPGQSSNQPDYVATITAQAGLIPQGGNQSTTTPAAVAVQTTGPSAPMAVETAATNCRTGPGTSYDIVTSLNSGQSEVVVGKDPPDNYWIVNNPNGAGTCWVWGQYATVTGDTNGLPQMAPPSAPMSKPTKTPKPASTSSSGSAPAAPSGLTGHMDSCTLTKTSLGGYRLAYRAALHWSLVPNAKGYRIYQGSTMLFDLDSTTDGTAWSSTVTNITATTGVSFGIEAYNNAGSSGREDISAKCP